MRTCSQIAIGFTFWPWVGRRMRSLVFTASRELSLGRVGLRHEVPRSRNNISAISASVSARQSSVFFARVLRAWVGTAVSRRRRPREFERERERLIPRSRTVHMVTANEFLYLASGVVHRLCTAPRAELVLAQVWQHFRITGRWAEFQGIVGTA
jgi:hypothetical protein